MGAVYRKTIITRTVERWRENHLSPIILSATGGMAKQASVFYKRLASLLSKKRKTTYSTTINRLHCTITFSLLRSAVQSIHGAHSAFHRPDLSNLTSLSNLPHRCLPEIHSTVQIIPQASSSGFTPISCITSKHLWGWFIYYKEKTL